MVARKNPGDRKVKEMRSFKEYHLRITPEFEETFELFFEVIKTDPKITVMVSSKRGKEGGLVCPAIKYLISQYVVSRKPEHAEKINEILRNKEATNVRDTSQNLRSEEDSS